MNYITGLVHRFLAGRNLEPKEVLWIVLICACLFASVHLVTMFLTRWGDHRVTGKALLFSLMLHFAFLISVVAVPRAPGIPGGGAEENSGPRENEHRLVIHSVSAQSQADSRDDKAASAGTAVWDRLPFPKTAKLMGPQLKQPAPLLPQKVERIEQLPQRPEFKPVELANVPEPKQAPPTPTKETAPPVERRAQTPQIEQAKTAAAPRPERPTPTLPKRELAPTATREANIERRGLEPGNSPLNFKNGTRPDAPPQSSPSAKTTLEPSAPLPKTPHPIVDAVPPSGRSSDPAVHAPIASAAQEPTLARPPVARQVPSGAGDPVHAHISEGRWIASIDRLRTGNTAGGSGGVEPKAPIGGADPSFETGTPSPEIKNPGAVPLIARRSVGVAPTYRLRKLSNRKANARQFGGNDSSERAVEASLRWLASVQSRNGSWEAKAFGAGQVKIDETGVDRDYAGREADSGVTALAVLAFLGAGYTHEEGQYADNVDRALHWLVKQQRTDGNLGSGAGHFASMYCHGIATYAIAEAYGMQNDPASNTMLRDPLARAVRFILENQNPDGGWRYVKGQKSDISMFGWQLMALKSAEIAGVAIPREAKSKMVGFLKARSLGEHDGLAAYREDESPTASMTAEALFCKQMLGIRRNNAACQEAADYLLARLPRRTDFNEYYWYYGTVAMYQYGGAGWQAWNDAVREILTSEQQTSGEFAGSWDPISPWSKYGGRIYVTALSTLCLEVYYRFLPLYQIGGAVKD